MAAWDLVFNPARLWSVARIHAMSIYGIRDAVGGRAAIGCWTYSLIIHIAQAEPTTEMTNLTALCNLGDIFLTRDNGLSLWFFVTYERERIYGCHWRSWRQRPWA